jgi:hypothetical protein
MIGEKEAELLSDVARLVRKYGSATVKSLAESLSSREFTEQVAAILNAAASLNVSKPQGKMPSLSLELSRLRDSDPKKYAVIRQFKEDLEIGDLLPTLKELKRFATENNLREPTSHSRAEAIPSLIRQLVGLPNAQLERAISHLERVIGHLERGSKTGSSLSQWSDIITQGMSRSRRNSEDKS